jgi:hypothetical protein
VPAVAQQEARQLLSRLAQAAHRRLTCTNDVADRFMGLIRNPDRGQFTGAVQLGKVDRIPPVGLDPLAWLSRDQRWRDDGAFVSRSAELSLNAVTARPGFVTEPQISSRRSQLHGQRLQGSRRIGDLPVLAHFSPQARCGQRHRYRILVHVKPDICDRLRHDPSPMHEARYRTIRHNPRSLHTVRRVAPISGEHLV